MCCFAMQLTTKTRINPTNEQVGVLWKLSDLATELRNLALANRKDAWENGGRSVSYIDQQNKLPAFKERYPEFRMVHSKTLQSVLRKLDADYRSFFALRKNGHEDAMPPGFKSRKYFMTLVYNQSGFKIDKDTITLSHKVSKVPLTFSVKGLIDGQKIKQIEIYNDNPFKAKGKFFLSIVYDEYSKKDYRDNNIYQAIDLGVTKIVTAVNTYGKFFEVATPRPDKYWSPKIDQVKSKRDHCKGVKKGSKKSRKYLRVNAVVKKMNRKLSNQNKDFQHKLSRKMVDNTKANTIIVGKLDVKNMAQSPTSTKGLNRATQNQGYLARFVGFLAYKAELVGKRVIRIDERNTTKECYVCGKLHDMPLNKRIMDCDCGNLIGRDRNSAIDIMKRFLSQNALWTGYEQFARNLRQTGLLTYETSVEADDASTRRKPLNL